MIYDRYIQREEPGKGRQRFIRDFLFFGCLTGKRLDTAFEPVFGSEWRWRIVWEEAHKDWGAVSNATFGYDVDHMRNVMAQYKPDVVMLFGKVAVDGFRAAALHEETDKRLVVIEAPHPAARGSNVVENLKRTAAKLLVHVLKSA